MGKVTKLDEYKDSKLPHMVVGLNRIGVNEVLVFPVEMLKNFRDGKINLDKNLLRYIVAEYLDEYLGYK
ncbi:hypothetical protein KAR91_56030 [Candidatus Pacearchaeota archaeon]|nr:hypothetical protein [Candidatus Pacearchaeota archaeon]